MNTTKVVAVPALDLQLRVPVKELRESPIEQDFNFYIQDVMRATNDRGSLPGYMEESLENYMSAAKVCLNVTQMKEDFNAVRCGDKKWQDVSSYNYCLDKLLKVDSVVVCSKQDTRALSKSVRELLEEEVRVVIAKDCRSLVFWRRHHNVKAHQYAAIKLLIERAKKGEPDVEDKDILDVMPVKLTRRVKARRVRGSFKRSSLWGTRDKPSLIISKKKGFRCLALYPENFEIPEWPT